MTRVGDPRAERIRANNERFRQANESIRDRADELGADMERIPFLCECPIEGCVEIVRLTRAQYTDVRENPRWFITAVGHEEAEKPVAEVVARNDGYVVVEKGPMEDREARIGLNEAVFREVNERIEGLAESFDLGSQPLDLICECGDASCVQRIHMTHAEFERLRSESHQFAVYPGHEAPDVERVVERHDGYDIVKKDEGLPKLVAERTDPQAG